MGWLRVAAFAWIALGVHILATGCYGSSEETESGCEKTQSTIGVDELPELEAPGVAELIGSLGEHRCAWRWEDPAPVGTMTPQAGESSADVALRLHPGTATVTTAQPIGAAELPGCTSHVEVEIEVQIRTDDGAIDHAFAWHGHIVPNGYHLALIDITEVSLPGFDFSWEPGWTEHALQLVFFYSSDGSLSGGLISYGRSPRGEWVNTTPATWTCPAASAS